MRMQLGLSLLRLSLLQIASMVVGLIGIIPFAGFAAEVSPSIDSSQSASSQSASSQSSDILDPLNFALAGRVEAWRGNLGVIFDGAYFDVEDDRSANLSIPNCLCNFLPSQIDTNIRVQYGQFDLGVGYRYGTNLANAATEFDMGPLVFDAIVGMRIYTFQQEIDIRTNVGIDRNLDSSSTLIQPLISGRFRWNTSLNFAGWVRGDIAGFGIGGTLFAASITGGIDWMFSGNTSLQVAYHLTSLQYNTDVRGEALGLNLLSHGPYLGVVFRF